MIWYQRWPGAGTTCRAVPCALPSAVRHASLQFGAGNLALPSLLVYLTGCTASDIAAFAVTAALSDRRDLAGYQGMASQRPWLAASLVVALLGLVGATGRVQPRRPGPGGHPADPARTPGTSARPVRPLIRRGFPGRPAPRDHPVDIDRIRYADRLVTRGSDVWVVDGGSPGGFSPPCCWR